MKWKEKEIEKDYFLEWKVQNGEEECHADKNYWESRKFDIELNLRNENDERLKYLCDAWYPLMFANIKRNTLQFEYFWIYATWWGISVNGNYFNQNFIGVVHDFQCSPLI